MPTNVNEVIQKLRPAQRRRVEARAAELVAEEMTLRELRKARKLTQVRMAKQLGITQDSVSRLEKRSDLLLSTLRKTVEAMGGSLSLVAEFPDRPPVVLSGIAGDDAPAGLKPISANLRFGAAGPLDSLPAPARFAPSLAAPSADAVPARWHLGFDGGRSGIHASDSAAPLGNR